MKQIALIVLLIISVHAFAYERKSDTTLHVSASGGITYNTLRNYYNDYQYRLAYNIHFFAEWQPTREFALRGGLSLLNKGFRQTASFSNIYNESFDTIQSISLTYLNIPLSVNYHFGKRFNPYIGVGINFGILIHARQFARLPETYNGAAVEPFEIDVKDTYNSIEFSLHALAGIEYRLKPNISVFAEVRYDYGLSNIFKGNNIVGGNHVKNNCIVSNIGVKIGIPIKYYVSTPSI
jgi:opacity protein-like surface antigen